MGSSQTKLSGEPRFGKRALQASLRSKRGLTPPLPLEDDTIVVWKESEAQPIQYSKERQDGCIDDFIITSEFTSAKNDFKQNKANLKQLSSHQSSWVLKTPQNLDTAENLNEDDKAAFETDELKKDVIVRVSTLPYSSLSTDEWRNLSQEHNILLVDEKMSTEMKEMASTVKKCETIDEICDQLDSSIHLPPILKMDTVSTIEDSNSPPEKPAMIILEKSLSAVQEAPPLLELEPSMHDIPIVTTADKPVVVEKGAPFIKNIHEPTPTKQATISDYYKPIFFVKEALIKTIGKPTPTKRNTIPDDQPIIFVKEAPVESIHKLTDTPTKQTTIPDYYKPIIFVKEAFFKNVREPTPTKQTKIPDYYKPIIVEKAAPIIKSTYEPSPTKQTIIPDYYQPFIPEKEPSIESIHEPAPIKGTAIPDYQPIIVKKEPPIESIHEPTPIKRTLIPDDDQSISLNLHVIDPEKDSIVSRDNTSEKISSMSSKKLKDQRPQRESILSQDKSDRPYHHLTKQNASPGKSTIPSIGQNYFGSPAKGVILVSEAPKKDDAVNDGIVRVQVLCSFSLTKEELTNAKKKRKTKF